MQVRAIACRGSCSELDHFSTKRVQGEVKGRIADGISFLGPVQIMNEEAAHLCAQKEKHLSLSMKSQMKKESVIIQGDIKGGGRPSFLPERQVTISLSRNHSRSDRWAGRKKRHFWL